MVASSSSLCSGSSASSLSALSSLSAFAVVVVVVVVAVAVVVPLGWLRAKTSSPPQLDLAGGSEPGAPR